VPVSPGLTLTCAVPVRGERVGGLAGGEVKDPLMMSLIVLDLLRGGLRLGSAAPPDLPAQNPLLAPQ